MKHTRFIIVVLAVAAVVMIAAAPIQEGVPDGADQFDALFLLLGLPALGAVPAALVNAGKSLGWIKDGRAPIFRALISIVLLAILYGFQLLAPDFLMANIGVIEGGAAGFVEFIGVLVQLALLILGSGLMHSGVLKGIPVIGKSYSENVG